MTSKVVIFKNIFAFIWQPTIGRLLNLTKASQNLNFFGNVFQNFKKSKIKYSIKKNSYFGEISPNVNYE
jgi:hypothetical protein